jgi:hypothetical protein
MTTGADAFSARALTLAGLPATRLALRYWLAATVVSLCLAAVWAARPARRDWLSREGGPIEGLTALLYLAGAALSVASLRRARREGQWARGDWLLAGLCMLGALDEVSYGDGMVPGLSFPVVLGVKIDAIHDLLGLGPAALRRIGVTGVRLGLTAAVAAAVSLAVGWSFRAELLKAWRKLDRFRLVCIAVVLGLAAQVMDLGRGSVFLEEVLELDAALALAFAALGGTRYFQGI